jgi:hypothetical protein
MAGVRGGIWVKFLTNNKHPSNLTQKEGTENGRSGHADCRAC